jgi:hypothetical protein
MEKHQDVKPPQVDDRRRFRPHRGASVIAPLSSGACNDLFRRLFQSKVTPVCANVHFRAVPVESLHITVVGLFTSDRCPDTEHAVWAERVGHCRQVIQSSSTPVLVRCRTVVFCGTAIVMHVDDVADSLSALTRVHDGIVDATRVTPRPRAAYHVTLAYREPTAGSHALAEAVLAAQELSAVLSGTVLCVSSARVCMFSDMGTYNDFPGECTPPSTPCDHCGVRQRPGSASRRLSMPIYPLGFVR